MITPKFPWILPKQRRTAYSLVMRSDKWDPAFIRAVREIADLETAKGMGKVSIPTVIMTLCLRKDVEQRSDIRRKYNHYKKEFNNHERTAVRERKGSQALSSDN